MHVPFAGPTPGLIWGVGGKKGSRLKNGPARPSLQQIQMYTYPPPPTLFNRNQIWKVRKRRVGEGMVILSFELFSAIILVLTDGVERTSKASYSRLVVPASLTAIFITSGFSCHLTRPHAKEVEMRR